MRLAGTAYQVELEGGYTRVRLQLARRAAQPGGAEHLRDGRSFASLMEFCSEYGTAFTEYTNGVLWKLL